MVCGKSTNLISDVLLKWAFSRTFPPGLFQLDLPLPPNLLSLPMLQWISIKKRVYLRMQDPVAHIQCFPRYAVR